MIGQADKNYDNQNYHRQYDAKQLGFYGNKICMSGLLFRSLLHLNSSCAFLVNLLVILYIAGSDFFKRQQNVFSVF